VDPNSLQLAKTIIQSRVDSLGVGESEVTTSGDNQIIVTVPNVQQDELVRLVGQTAVLRFRAVYAAEQVQPPEPAPTATSEPTQGGSRRQAAPLLALRDSPGSVRAQRPAGTQPVRQQQAAARSANCSAGPAGQGLRLSRRQGNSARQGAGLAAN
jgi:preprotein translocase subunit SecD